MTALTGIRKAPKGEDTMTEMHSDMPYQTPADGPGFEVKIHFIDDTYTVIHVPNKHGTQDGIAKLCEANGWPREDVTSFEIIA